MRFIEGFFAFCFGGEEQVRHLCVSFINRSQSTSNENATLLWHVVEVTLLYN